MNNKFLIVGTGFMTTAILALAILTAVSGGRFVIVPSPTPALACGGGACCSGAGTAAASSSNIKLISSVQSVKTNIDKALTALQKADTKAAITQLKLAEQELSVFSVGNLTTSPRSSPSFINVGASSCGCGGGGSGTVTGVSAC
jgi:hypothetical protein